MDKMLVVSPSPHIHSGNSTSKIMSDVIIALLPAFVVSTIFYGFSSVVITAIAVVSCILAEYVIGRLILKRGNTLMDYSAALTGVLLAFNLPAFIPWWMVVLGSVVAIGVGKMSFGGLGRNLFNPALVGRVFLLISFPVQMTSFFPAVPSGVDAVSGSTPLAVVKGAMAKGLDLTDVMSQFSITNLFIGDKAGSLGEIAAGALLLGFIYLLVRKVITWHIPVYVLGSMFLFSGVLYLVEPTMYAPPLFQILTGGALLGAIFMATDYVTSPMSHRGMLIYGVGIGVITILIRVWGAYPEGISFAILIMNGVVPLINMYTHPKRFGEKVKKSVV